MAARMTEELPRRGYCVNHKRAKRLMGVYGIVAKDPRRKTVRTDGSRTSRAPPLQDLVKSDFSVGAPGEGSVGDITYVATYEGWLYVADVRDIGSRRIIGFAVADHLCTELVASAMDMAIAARGGGVAGIIFHHGRVQYMSRDLRDARDATAIAQSSGRTGPHAPTTRWPEPAGLPQIAAANLCRFA